MQMYSLLYYELANSVWMLMVIVTIITLHEVLFRSVLGLLSTTNNLKQVQLLLFSALYGTGTGY